MNNDINVTILSFSFHVYYCRMIHSFEKNSNIVQCYLFTFITNFPLCFEFIQFTKNVNFENYDCSICLFCVGLKIKLKF